MKSKVIFIGSFKQSAKDGSVGGQIFACTSLINSSLKEDLDFILIDSTADSVPVPPVHKRLLKAIARLAVLLKHLCNKKAAYVLIFSSAGFSLLEKGLMAILSKCFGKKVFFAPRSGLIRDDYENSVFFKWYIPVIIKYADVIICQGNAWKEFYQKISKADDRKFLVVPNWIDVKPYLQNNPVYKTEEPVTILYMGWLEKYKGIFDLLEAIHLLKEKGLDFKVKICGMGSAKEEMLNRLEQYNLQNTVEYVGWVTGKDKMNQFQKTDMFILPSHREGMPNVLIEAMVSGIPVVATKVGGVPELVEDGDNGFLVNLGEPQEMAEAMEKLIVSKELRIKFSENGRKSILKNNSVEHIAMIFRKHFSPIQ